MKAERFRKLRPLNIKEAVRADFVDPELNRLKDDFATRRENLQKIKEHRRRKKEASIRQALTHRVTQRRVIEASYGQLFFFEIAFSNPYPRKAVFEVIALIILVS